MELSDIDLFEMHEAFGAQVVSNLKALASRRFARQELGRDRPVGEVDLGRWNVHGGTLALGHPFGATGARLTLQLLHGMARRGLGTGMVVLGGAGGLGYALIFERQ
jgi:acetyl-CoA acyltransferase